MCGIVGLFKKGIDYEKALKESWERMRHRGEDSYGVLVCYNNDNIKIIKSLNMELVLNKVKEMQEKEDIHWILGHNRKASVGSVIPELAHPIVYRENNKKYVIIHNGTKKSIVELFDNYDSDTEALCELVHIISSVKTKKKLLEDTGVIFAFNFNSNYLIFHKSNRTLYYSPDLNMIASETIFSANWQTIRNIDYLKINLNKYKHYNFVEALPKLNDLKHYDIVEKRCLYCGKTFVSSNPDRLICDSCSKIETYYGNYNYKGGKK
jgi:predicted glutamine amidotransferase